MASIFCKSFIEVVCPKNFACFLFGSRCSLFLCFSRLSEVFSGIARSCCSLLCTARHILNHQESMRVCHSIMMKRLHLCKDFLVLVTTQSTLQQKTYSYTGQMLILSHRCQIMADKHRWQGALLKYFECTIFCLLL